MITVRPFIKVFTKVTPSRRVPYVHVTAKCDNCGVISEHDQPVSSHGGVLDGQPSRCGNCFANPQDDTGKVD